MPAGAPKGNTNGSKSNRMVGDVLKMVVTQNKEKLRKGLELILDEAEKGDLYAMNFIADRLDGKPKQQTEVTGADGKDLIPAERPQLSREDWLKLHAVG